MLNVFVRKIADIFILLLFSFDIGTYAGIRNEDIGRTDLIIFSYNRPMQLYALLESIEKYLAGIEGAVVIYRTSNERFAKSYEILKLDFPFVHFVKQTKAPDDFKPLLMRELSMGKAAYIVFAVDDMIVKNPADLRTCTRIIEETGAYGFFFRLGTHVNASYPSGKINTLPVLQEIEPSIFAWSFNDKNAIGDWNYPTNVDMTIYPKCIVQNALKSIRFRNPNKMEVTWGSRAAKISKNKKGLCYNNSIVINIPTNQVQTEWQMPYMHSWSPQALLELFEAGMKIDITPFQGIKNNMCHMDYELRFISRAGNNL